MVTAISSRISYSFSLLMEQEQEYRSHIYHILSVKDGLRFLETIFNVSKNEDLNLRIQGVVDNLLVELPSLSNRPRDGSLVWYLDDAYDNLVETMKNVFINPGTREYDVMFPVLVPDLACFLGYSELLRKILQNMSLYIPKDIREKLLFLQGLVTYVANVGENIDVGDNEVFATLRALIDKSSFLVYSFVDGGLEPMGQMELAMYHNLCNSLEKNKVKEIYLAALGASNFRYFTGRTPLKSEIHLLIVLIWILRCNTSFVRFSNDSSIKLHDKLDKLQIFLKDLPRHVAVRTLSYLVPSAEAIISGAIPIIYSCYDDDINKEMVNGSIQVLSDQIERIQARVFEAEVFEAEVFEMKLYKYPKIDELAFLDLFLEHLEELLKRRPELSENLKNQVETLHLAFDSLRSFLRKINKQHTEHKELGDLWTCILELAYQAEYIIDLFLVKIARGMCMKMFSFSNLIEQAKCIMSDIKVIYDEKKYHSQAHGVVKRSNPLPSQATNATTNKVVVGFEDEAEKIMEYLLGDSKQLDVYSIVGMPGLGKTTIAKKMYEATKAHFDIRAWCSISQTYQKKELLITLLGDFIVINEDTRKLNDEELAAKLNKSLRGRRFLIVIDDLWDTNAWHDLQRIFPDEKFQSRILITTRLHNVASQVKVGSKVHPLRRFSDEESWELFQKKLPKRESFSQKFMDIGRQIAESCNGLPLSIVVATGLLAKLEKNIDLWEQIAGSSSSHIFSDSEAQCMAILELSYKELPDPLKSCFLYIGAFPEDAEIPVQKLKMLWIAEGFIRNCGEKSWRI